MAPRGCVDAPGQRRPPTRVRRTCCGRYWRYAGPLSAALTNETAAQSWLSGRSSHRHTVDGAREPPFFFNLPPLGSWTETGGQGRASALIPRLDGHPTRFIRASAASRIGSRTDPSHCSPRRQIGEGEARDWLHQPRGVIAGIHGCLHLRACALPRLCPPRPACRRSRGLRHVPADLHEGRYQPAMTLQVPDFIRVRPPRRGAPCGKVNCGGASTCGTSSTGC
jgi:hypothetical protein